LKEIATENNIQGSFEELCKNKAVSKILLEIMTKHGKSEGLHSFEQVKYIHLNPVSFGVYGVLTPTLKL